MSTCSTHIQGVKSEKLAQTAWMPFMKMLEYRSLTYKTCGLTKCADRVLKRTIEAVREGACAEEVIRQNPCMSQGGGPMESIHTCSCPAKTLLLSSLGSVKQLLTCPNCSGDMSTTGNAPVGGTALA